MSVSVSNLTITTSSEKPLHLTETDCMITVSENATVVFFDAYKNNVTRKIHVGKNANVTHYVLQIESDDTQYSHQLDLTQQENSTVRLYPISLGAAKTTQTITCALNAKNASVSIFALYQASGDQQFDLQTRMLHNVGHCNSTQVIKGVASDAARVAFDGKIIVKKDAQKTTAHLKNKNLLLSSEAVVDTRPALEIYADDVKCSHGATVGFLDQDALFYLRSRGIFEKEARQLLIQSFVNEILDEMPCEKIRQYIAMGPWSLVPGTENQEKHDEF